jgi:flavodoxin I
MKTIAIFYGSSTGNTQSVAEAISKKLSGNEVYLYDVSKAKAEDVEKFDNIILGTSTWGFGDLQDDWDSFLPVLAKANLEGKTVALFGLGDSSSYSDTFVNGMRIIFDALASKKCKITGSTDSSGYSFSDSEALYNGSFVGLPLDEDNESTLTNSRLDAWISKIMNDFK